MTNKFNYLPIAAAQHVHQPRLIPVTIILVFDARFRLRNKCWLAYDNIEKLVKRDQNLELGAIT